VIGKPVKQALRLEKRGILPAGFQEQAGSDLPKESANKKQGQTKKNAERRKQKYPKKDEEKKPK